MNPPNASPREIVGFSDPDATDHALVGGKGANLGRLAQSGFRVPDGFTVTTEAYRSFIRQNDLTDQIGAIVGELDYDNADDLESRTEELRGKLVAGEFSVALRSAVERRYRLLGDDIRVAVRSSGTAEDLQDASFAGQHDTYLHIRTIDDVIDAIKRCWASLWTARATAYRQKNGISHLDVEIGVVVQQMVDAAVSGVLFTANPITSATNEIVIEASWGLGESVVAGIVTPDSYRVAMGTLRVKEKNRGSKLVQTVLDPDRGSGTVTVDVSPADRDRYTLTEEQVAELAAVSRDVMEYYGGFPQDIEWAYRDGEFYLLQSRPITAVEFTWDSDLDEWQTLPEPEDDIVWTRTMADMVWTGAVTPLFYTVRGRMLTNAHTFTHRMWGLYPSSQYRYYRYWKSTPYHNTKVERAELSLLPLAMRKMAVGQHIPPPHQDEALEGPGGYARSLYLLFRLHTGFPEHGLYKWLTVMRQYLNHERDTASGLNNAQLRALSDAALLRYTDKVIEYEDKYIQDVWNGFIFFLKMLTILQAWLLDRWYDGDNKSVAMDLTTGQKRRSATMIENLTLWQLSEKIRGSAKLADLFRVHADGEFFAAVEAESEDLTCKEFIAEYSKFLETSGHRGHSDRDIYFTRRIEDPRLDYVALRSYLSVSTSEPPTQREGQANKKRIAAYEDVVANLRKKPLGAARAEFFKWLYSYLEELMVLRDDHREFVDICTFTYKRALLEINRRLLDRGQLDSDRDFYFLGKSELYDLFEGRGNAALLKAKIAGRMRNFDRVDNKDVVSPVYLYDDRPAVFADEELDDNVLQGAGTSGGSATGTARVVKTLGEIGRVKEGDIMVVNATDPGWTPVFLLLRGLILESGGHLSHGASLSREYGIPAMQLPNAMRRIPDGATITIDGDTGRITLEDDINAEGVPVSAG